MDDLQQFTWNKEKKKFVSPDGKILQGREVLDLLNNMLGAISVLGYAWRIISEGAAVMDGVFLGASEVVADGDSDSGNVEQPVQTGEVDGAES